MASPILFVTPHPSFGGGERLLAMMTRHLARNGHACHLAIAAARPGASSSLAAWFGHLASHCRLHDGPDFFAALDEAVAQSATVAVVLYGYSPGYAHLPRLRAARPDLRIVSFQFNARECIVENRRYGALIDMVIAESRDAVRALVRSGAMGPPVNIISSGIDAAAIAARPRSPRKDDRLCIGYVGRFDRIKNPDGFVKTVAALGAKPFRYVMAGESHAFAAAAGIEMLGLLGDEALQALMDEIDILVVPSWLDGRPLIIHEARARRVAIVASRVGGIPEMIADGVTGLLCEPGDYAAFARAVLRLAGDGALRTRIAGAGFAEVMEKGDIAQALPAYAAAITGEAQGRASGTIASRRSA